jgi:hypothetical protein
MNSEFYVDHNKIMDIAFRACFNICDSRYIYVCDQRAYSPFERFNVLGSV